MKKNLLNAVLVFCSMLAFSQQFTWKSVNNQGMGYVTGMVIHPDTKNAPDLIYVRTDVGGAYRFDPLNQKWIQLMDFASSAQIGYYRVESMALDPKNLDLVYASVDGSNGGGGDILKSSDRGSTWQSTGMVTQNIYIAGNDPWRGSSGERLIVDPNNPNILYYASRKNGLWKKEGTGIWTKVAGGLAATTANPGFTFVVFDPNSSDGQRSKTIFTGCSGSGIWKSDDAGTTWTNIDGGTNSLRANLSTDSTLYVSFGGNEQDYQGPGKVAKHKKGTWTTITPPSGTNVSYSGICTDPTNPNVVAVTTHQRAMYYSTNKGSSWIKINPKFSYYPAYYNAGESSFNWGTAALIIDPNNVKRLWSTNGYGVVKTDNYTMATSSWTVVMNNLEELCTLAICTPPLEGGADLFTVGMDMVGMRNASRDIVPTKKIAVFPYVAMGVSMEYCQTKPNHIVFLGLDETNANAYQGYSKDNGLTWNTFNTSPGKGGKLVVSATNENNWVWTPDKAQPQFTMDAGKTWTVCKGISAPSHESTWGQMNYLASDKVNGNRFYYTDNRKLYYTLDSGANWTLGYSGLPGWPQKMFLKAHPFHEGELWYTAMPNGTDSKTKVYVSKDGGKKFTVLTNMIFANNVAFGRGDNDTIPYVYLSGKIDSKGPEGIFKSEDEGKTWTLISDPTELQIAIVLEADMRYKNLVYTGRGTCRGVTYGMADGSVGLNQYKKSDKNIKVFPNPTSNEITIQSDDKISNIRIFDMVGKINKQISIDNFQATFSVSDLEPGCYLVRAETTVGPKVIEILKN